MRRKRRGLIPSREIPRPGAASLRPKTSVVQEVGAVDGSLPGAVNDGQLLDGSRW